MRLSRLINILVGPVKALKYKSLKGINSRRDFYKIIERERERANRNNHRVSLVVFNLESFPDNGKQRKQLIRKIITEKREIDELGWYNKHSVGVILPYTSSNGARQFSVRLSRTLDFIMPDSFCFLFTYPIEDISDDDGECKDYKAVESTPDDVAGALDDAESTAHDDEHQFDDYGQKTFARSVKP